MTSSLQSRFAIAVRSQQNPLYSA